MPNGSAFITVARSDADAAKLVYGAEFGTIWLSKQTETTRSATRQSPLSEGCTNEPVCRNHSRSGL